MKTPLPEILRKLADLADLHGGEIPDHLLHPTPAKKSPKSIAKSLVKKHLHGKPTNHRKG